MPPSILDKIVAADDVKVAPVDVPEWPEVKLVFVRMMNGAEFDKVVREKDRMGDVSFAALVLCDKDGNRLCKNGDESKLGKKSAIVIRRIAQAGMHLNAMTEEAQAELEKNSSGTGGDGSS